MLHLTIPPASLEAGGTEHVILYLTSVSLLKITYKERPQKYVLLLVFVFALPEE